MDSPCMPVVSYKYLAHLSEGNLRWLFTNPASSDWKFYAFALLYALDANRG